MHIGGSIFSITFLKFEIVLNFFLATTGRDVQARIERRGTTFPLSRLAHVVNWVMCHIPIAWYSVHTTAQYSELRHSNTTCILGVQHCTVSSTYSEYMGFDVGERPSTRDTTFYVYVIVVVTP
jgi:hypothetical protein